MDPITRRDFLAASGKGLLGAALSGPAMDALARSRIEGTGSQLIPVDAKAFPDLFTFSDTCNVYVLRDGDAALLIDLGDAGVLQHLPEIGVKRVEWVLFTHHHREQCQGLARLKEKSFKIAAPRAEQTLFERPADFRKMKPSLGDPFTVYGSSFVRPAIQPIRVDLAFNKMDSFRWRGYEFVCIDTPGNSPGGMSYLLNAHGRWFAFSGDVMLDGARMHTWFDSDWDYGYASGISALYASAAILADYDPYLLLPSHGPLVPHPKTQLQTYQKRLENLERLLLRGYPKAYTSTPLDKTSRPTAVPFIWQVSPHLFKFKGPNLWANFSLILADSGHALVMDCGCLEEAFLDHALERMRAQYGLKAIDAMFVSHMHGDHVMLVPYLQKKMAYPDLGARPHGARPGNSRAFRLCLPRPVLQPPQS